MEQNTNIISGWDTHIMNLYLMQMGVVDIEVMWIL